MTRSRIFSNKVRWVAGTSQAQPPATFFETVLIVTCLLGSLASAVAADLPVSDVLLNALGSELQRSISLRLGNLEPPYFIQYTVDDSVTHRLSAAYGALVSSNDSRSRVLHSQVRVGSYEFDNSNFAGRGGFGGFGGTRGPGISTELPTDNDDLALRHAVWSATDSLYKSSVATLAQKRAYMRERNVGDRPHDFTKAIAPTTELLEPAELAFDRAPWEDYVRKISKQFGAYPDIQDADVSLTVGAETRYLVNSEGSRVRCGSTGVSLRIAAEAQASDGERITDSLNYFAWTPDQLPKLDTVLAEVEKLASRLAGASQASILEDYTGPVLVDGLAASQLFRQLLAQGITAQAEPLGAMRRTDGEDLQSRLGKRILPVTFHIYDDPRQLEYQGTYLAGHYRIDDEGLPPERVEIVVDGKLDGMVTSRTPTKPFSKSNGHGRRGSGAAASASIGCLFVEASKGLSVDELKQELIDAADAEGLKFGLRITSIRNRAGGALGALASALGRRGGGPSIASRVGDPISIYKVHVEDGREEPVRGCEFVALDIRSLRRIIAAGKDQTVHNSVGGIAAASSVLAPALLFEELELSRIKQEPEKKPILAAPHARK